MQLLLADVILVIHFLFIAFVVLGQIGIMIGAVTKWSWVRNMKFRIAHLICIFIVAVQAWAGSLCPLTTWENNLRRAAGESGYEGSFVSYWLGRLIYIDAPLWAFAVVYTLFGVLVVMFWFIVRPKGKARSSSVST